MRIKKNAIIEAATNAIANSNTSNATTTNTSNTTSSQNNNNTNKVNLPNPEDIKKSKEEIDKLKGEVGEINKEVKDGPMGAFLKINEFDDPNYGMGDDLEYLSSVREKLINDYNEWLNTPDGVEYMKKISRELSGTDNVANNFDDLPFNEGFKNKKRVIKTIKVKDLRNG